MTGQFIPDDTEAIRDWARALAAIAHNAKARAKDIAGVAATTNAAGAGAAVDSLRTSLVKIEHRLTTAAENLSRGAIVLQVLAQTLDRLEQDAERKFRNYGSPKRWTPEWLVYEAMGQPHVETRAAHIARRSAARDLQRLAEAAPGAQHQEGGLDGFLHHVGSLIGGARRVENNVRTVAGHVGAGLVEGAVGTVKLGYGVARWGHQTSPMNFFVNHKQWESSWRGTVETAGFMVTHPKQTGSAFWDGFIDKDMYEKDKAAWAILMVANLAGPKGLGKVGDAAQGARTTDKGSEGLRTGTKAGVPSRTSAGFDHALKSMTLERFEQLGGHTKDRHLLEEGQDARLYMAGRLDTYPNRTKEGVFSNEAAANNVMQEGLKLNQAEVTGWLTDPTAIEPLTIRFVTTKDIGQTMFREANGSYTSGTSDRILMTLIKDPSASEGFYLLRMFPEY